MSLPHGLLADAAADFVAVELRQADVEQHDVGPVLLDRFDALRARRAPCTSRGPSSAAASRASRPSPRCRRRPGSAASRGGLRRRSTGSAPCSGCSDRRHRQTHDELAPSPSPALFASIVPPCISTSRFTSVKPMPSPPCARLQRPVDLREHVEDARELVGRDADAGVLHRHHDLAPLPLARSAMIFPPRVRVLAGVVEQVAEHLGEAGRVGVSARCGSAGKLTRSSWPSDSASGPARFHRLLDHRVELDAARPQLEPIVRDAVQVQQIVDQAARSARAAAPSCRARTAEHSRIVRALPAPRARSRAARAGCAARGRASRETRPCGDPLRTDRPPSRAACPRAAFAR